jgi:predicted ester cyclase
MRSAAVVVLGLVIACASLLSFDHTASVAQEATPATDMNGDCPQTTEEQNADLVRSWYEAVWDQRDLDLIDDILAPNYVRYRAGVPFDNESGTADDRAFVEALLAEFPDIKFSVEDLLVDGDKVAVRTIATGTQMGPMTDLGNAAATERQMSRENLAIWRIECGKLAEQWIVQDNLGMLRQLGVITQDEMADAAEPDVATPVP